MEVASGDEQLFLGVDGDGVGRALQAMLVREDLGGVVAFSESIARAVEDMARHIADAGGVVIVTTGDGLFADIRHVPSNQVSTLCDQLEGRFLAITGRTASAAVGNTPGDVILAMAERKDRLVYAPTRTAT